MNIQVIFFILAIIISGMLSASETALLSFNSVDLRGIDENSKVYKSLRYWLKNPDYILSSILILNNISNILVSSLSAYVIHNSVTSGYYIIFLITMILSFIIVIFGEITPKLIAKNYSKTISKLMILPILILSKIFYPLVYLLINISKMISWILGFKITEKSVTITEKDILSLISVGEQEGVIVGEKKKMIDGIFKFASKSVEDIAIPRTNVFMLQADILFEEAIPLIIEYGYSRIPIYDKSIDDVIGAVYSKDLVEVILKNNNKNIKIRSLMREIHYVPDTSNPLDLLKDFKEKRIHIAVVLDEYGGTVGIVTIEDILEEIVGEIDDEFDKDPKDIRVLSDNEFIAKADIDIEELNRELKLNIPLSEDYDSLGGFITSYIGRIPMKNESIKWDNIEFTITEVLKHTIKYVSVRIEERNV